MIGHIQIPDISCLPFRYASHNFAPITSSNRMINHPNTTSRGGMMLLQALRR
ncbi:hypothetical protein M119_3108 [Bacteroides fragilis str. 3783N1-6]|uniref:Uncharacterized protein n=1 Tax=Bacteroides fragilis str. 3783N1-6 TaxID=1339310 RepID=A0AB73AID1_BACFG|nr:hypothetical protein M121_2716 [Bacteroides fragilis str. 3783N2-1]EYB08922.1 hypothetical protein M119_3108 [Bacteroides fragilis str. 3783N1-6]